MRPRFTVALIVLLMTALGSLAQAKGPRVKTVLVRGTSLAYIDQGRGEPVIFIHGWLWDYRAWSAQWPELSKRYRVISYSRRYNHPNNPTDGGKAYGAATDVEDLVAMIKALKLRRVHLVGHSAGGSIALLVARDHPELVRSLMLGEAFMPEMLAQNAEALPLLQRLAGAFEKAEMVFKAGDLRGTATVLADEIVGKKGAFDQMPPERQRQIFDNMRVEMKAQVTPPPKAEPSFSCADARRIKAPTLLIEGEQTIRVVQLMDQEFLKCIPGSERVVLPNATHALQLENPAGFNQIVQAFLQRQSHN